MIVLVTSQGPYFYHFPRIGHLLEAIKAPKATGMADAWFTLAWNMVINRDRPLKRRSWWYNSGNFISFNFDRIDIIHSEPEKLMKSRTSFQNCEPVFDDKIQC